MAHAMQRGEARLHGARRLQHPHRRCQPSERRLPVDLAPIHPCSRQLPVQGVVKPLPLRAWNSGAVVLDEAEASDKGRYRQLGLDLEQLV